MESGGGMIGWDDYSLVVRDGGGSGDSVGKLDVGGAEDPTDSGSAHSDDELGFKSLDLVDEVAGSALLDFRFGRSSVRGWLAAANIVEPNSLAADPVEVEVMPRLFPAGAN
jgi:hypothetical protein